MTATNDDEREHTCHARGCKVPCAPEMLMCAAHWRLVPQEIQRRVYREYREGQCDGDTAPSAAWHSAANAAISAVAWIEAKRRANELHGKQSTNDGGD